MRIMIVDNYREMRELLRDVVENIGGFTAFEARSEHQAEALSPNVKPDLVLWNMGDAECDAGDFVRRMRERTGANHLPFIICADAFITPHLLQSSTGNTRLLNKPFEISDLEKMLQPHMCPYCGQATDPTCAGENHEQ